MAASLLTATHVINRKVADSELNTSCNLHVQNDDGYTWQTTLNAEVNSGQRTTGVCI